MARTYRSPRYRPKKSPTERERLDRYMRGIVEDEDYITYDEDPDCETNHGWVCRKKIEDAE